MNCFFESIIAYNSIQHGLRVYRILISELSNNCKEWVVSSKYWPVSTTNLLCQLPSRVLLSWNVVNAVTVKYNDCISIVYSGMILNADCKIGGYSARITGHGWKLPTNRTTNFSLHLIDSFKTNRHIGMLNSQNSQPSSLLQFSLQNPTYLHRYIGYYEEKISSKFTDKIFDCLNTLNGEA